MKSTIEFDQQQTLFLAFRGNVLQGRMEGPYSDMWRSCNAEGAFASQSLGVVSKRDVFTTSDEAVARATEQRAEYRQKQNSKRSSKYRTRRASSEDRLIGADYTSRYDNND